VKLVSTAPVFQPLSTAPVYRFCYFKPLAEGKRMMKSLGARWWGMSRKPILSLIAASVLLCSVGLSAQNRGDDQGNYEGTANGVSAGGNWMKYSAEDRMTAARHIRFELPANQVANSDDRAKIILYCSNGKLNLADFRPNMQLSRPNWPGFWGQPQMRVRVRVDDSHSDHSWNWVNGHFLSMDKGTTREMIGAHLFRIEFLTHDGPEIAEFSPAGLDLKLVKDACNLTPKKP
jgi:hypothetical protein